MRISLKVTTRAKKEAIEKLSENSYKIKVSVPPEKGRANERIIELLSEKLRIKKRDIKIIRLRQRPRTLSGEEGDIKGLRLRRIPPQQLREDG